MFYIYIQSLYRLVCGVFKKKIIKIQSKLVHDIHIKRKFWTFWYLPHANIPVDTATTSNVTIKFHCFRNKCTNNFHYILQKYALHIVGGESRLVLPHLQLQETANSRYFWKLLILVSLNCSCLKPYNLLFIPSFPNYC